MEETIMQKKSNNGRTNSNNPQNKNPDSLDNIGYIQYLNRQILKLINSILMGSLPIDEHLKKTALEKDARVLGNKSNMAQVISEVADTELKIEKQRMPVSNAPPPDVPMDEKDVSLVNQYIDKNKK